MDWQPIETAPRNQPVLVAEAISDRYFVTVRELSRDYRGESVWTGGGYGDPPPDPTHWMPLPDPPTASPARAESS